MKDFCEEVSTPADEEVRHGRKRSFERSALRSAIICVENLKQPSITPNEDVGNGKGNENDHNDDDDNDDDDNDSPSVAKKFKERHTKSDLDSPPENNEEYKLERRRSHSRSNPDSPSTPNKKWLDCEIKSEPRINSRSRSREEILKRRRRNYVTSPLVRNQPLRNQRANRTTKSLDSYLRRMRVPSQRGQSDRQRSSLSKQTVKPVEEKNERNAFRYSLYLSLNSMLHDKTGQRLVPHKSDIYKEHLIVRRRTQREVEIFRLRNEITIGGSGRQEVPNPIQSFDEVSFDGLISRALKRQGYENPTPIQAQGWPLALSGRNVVGIAGAGSGKKLAYILPAIEHVSAQLPLERGDGPIAVILVPTRASAQEIQREICAYSNPCRLRSMCLFGGGYRKLLEDLATPGYEVILATPGRLLDFLGERRVNLNRCSYLVLDEADVMLELGFERQLNRVFERTRPDLQILMWSSTWPPVLERLATRNMPRFTQINVGAISPPTANHDVSQVMEIVKEEDKLHKLKELLTEIYDTSDHPGKILVFAERKTRVSTLNAFIGSFVRCESIHGDKSQAEREQVLRDFRKGVYNILVATDITALNIPAVKYVINYDFPCTMESYLQRIEHTAQTPQSKSFTFLTNLNEKQFRPILKMLKDAKQPINPDLQRLSTEVDCRTKKRRQNRKGKS